MRPEYDNIEKILRSVIRGLLRAVALLERWVGDDDEDAQAARRRRVVAELGGPKEYLELVRDDREAQSR